MEVRKWYDIVKDEVENKASSASDQNLYPPWCYISNIYNSISGRLSYYLYWKGKEVANEG